MIIDKDLACKCCGALPEQGIYQKLLDGLNLMSQIIDFHIESGYRCAKNNAQAGGLKDSAHRYGFAVDLHPIPDGTVSDLATATRGLFPREGLGVYDWGIHVDTIPWPRPGMWNECQKK